MRILRNKVGVMSGTRGLAENAGGVGFAWNKCPSDIVCRVSLYVRVLLMGAHVSLCIFSQKRAERRAWGGQPASSQGALVLVDV